MIGRHQPAPITRSKPSARVSTEGEETRMPIEAIRNFIRIDDAVATGGQPTAEQFAEVREAGYEVVINLAPDGLDSSLPDEDALLRSMGMEYVHIPVPWTAPRLEHFIAFVGAMDRTAGRRTLIHCQANFRVTAFYACYAALRLGWDEERRARLVDRVWGSTPDYRMDAAWKDFMDEAMRLGAQG